jgi:hypothetical protein
MKATTMMAYLLTTYPLQKKTNISPENRCKDNPHAENTIDADSFSGIVRGTLCGVMHLSGNSAAYLRRRSKP